MNNKRIVSVLIIVICFVFAFTTLAISGIEDEKLIQGSNPDDTQIDDSTEAKVVNVTADDTALNDPSSSQQNNDLSPIDNATSLAAGYIQSGKSQDEIITTLTADLGYTKTEAQIAYSKASTQSDPGAAAVDTDTVNADVDETLPQVSPEDRAAETLKPRVKFKKKGSLLKRLISGLKSVLSRRAERTPYYKVGTQDQVDTVNGMLDEGYTHEQIAEGFASNGYRSNETAAIFKSSGVSVDDAYKALSSAAVKKAEANAGEKAPKSKFIKRIGKTTDEQHAIVKAYDSLFKGGYEIDEPLDIAVQDLIDAGMTEEQAMKFLK